MWKIKIFHVSIYDFLCGECKNFNMFTFSQTFFPNYEKYSPSTNHYAKVKRT